MSQTKNILNHLQTYGHITPLQALNLYGCFRLAARIKELRKEHYIETKTLQTEKGSYADYQYVGVQS